MEPILVQAAGREAAARHHAQAVYRRRCISLVSKELDRTNTQPRVQSAKLAWLRRKTKELEPVDCGNVIRAELGFYRSDLDSFNEQWDRQVSHRMGDNDLFHNQFWAGLAGEEEKTVLAAGSHFNVSSNKSASQLSHMPSTMEKSDQWFYMATLRAFCTDFLGQKEGITICASLSC